MISGSGDLRTSALGQRADLLAALVAGSSHHQSGSGRRAGTRHHHSHSAGKKELINGIIDFELIHLIKKAHDPLTGLLISHFNLVNPMKAEAEVSGNRTDVPEVLSLESLFDQVLPAAEEPVSAAGAGEASNATSGASVAEVSEADVMSMIQLNSLTGEIVFKKVVDYEELINKVGLA